MDKTYKALKKFGEYRKGEVIEGSMFDSQEEIDTFISDGVIELVKENAPESKKTSVTVEWNGMSRVYSLEVHGEKFMDLAQEFATKKNGTIL